MKTTRVLLFLFIAFAIAWGCKKEESDDTPAPSPSAPGQSVFQGLFADNIADATQEFAMNAAVGGQLIAAQGTQLVFEPSAFRHADGTMVTGPVDVSVVEALTIGDMIWLNKQTVGNDNGTLRMLRSGGAINVYASQGGELLEITQTGLIAKIPVDVGDPEMALFSGTEDAAGNMIWDPIDSASVTVDPGYYTAPVYVFPYYFNYTLNAPNLQWINCDYFYSYGNITPITATIPAGQSTDSTRVWIAFPTENAVTGMSHSTGQSYWTGGGYQVPVGYQAVIVGLQQTASGYASSFNTVTITSNMTVPMTFSPTTLAQFEAELNAL